MCLAIPGRIVRIDGSAADGRTAEIDYGPVRRSAHLLYVPEARVGDYVIVQAGFALRTVSPEEAEESLRAAEELGNHPEARAALPAGASAVLPEHRPPGRAGGG